jgi:hypothetical protein
VDLEELIAELSADGADSAAILARLSDEDLEALAGQIVARFNDLRADAEHDDDALAAAEQLADVHRVVSEEAASRDAANTERANRLAELAAQLGTDSGDDNTGGDDGENTDGDGDDSDEDDETGDGGTSGSDSGVEATAPAGQASVTPPPAGGGGGTALATRPARPRAALARAARSSGRPKLPKDGGPRSRLRASAGLPGANLGQELDLLTFAAQAADRFSASEGMSGKTQFALATIERPFPRELTTTEGQDHTAVIDYAADHTRLPGNSLLAAGGWCAPSETLYDIATYSTVSGILSTPEISVRRGGLRWAGSPDFSAIYANTGFTMTEAQNIAGFTKPCYEIPCPGFTEARLDAMGLCLTAGVLQSRGYPEQVATFISEALVAHAHRVNAEKIKRMAALAVPVAAGARRLGPFLDALDQLELQIEDVRYKYRLAPDAPVEAVLPLWLRPILRTDLQRRLNLQEPSVADAALTARFRERFVAVQWVYDWQDALVNNPADPDTGLFGGATPITDYPTEVKALIYPAGAYIVANDPILRLEGIYDSVNIRTNTYTALFTEESILVAKRHLEARLVTLAIDRRFPTS